MPMAVSSGESPARLDAFSAGGDQSPAFSPDGTKLVFARDRGDNAQGALEIVGVDGHGPP